MPLPKHYGLKERPRDWDSLPNKATWEPAGFREPTLLDLKEILRKVSATANDGDMDYKKRIVIIQKLLRKQ